MKTDARRPLLLLEILIGLLFFTLACTVLSQVYAAAYRQGHETLNDSQTLLIAEDIIERFSASDQDAESYLKAEGFAAEGESLLLEREISGRTVSFSAKVTSEARALGTLEGFELSARENAREIFSLTAARYDPKEATSK